MAKFKNGVFGFYSNKQIITSEGRMVATNNIEEVSSTKYSVFHKTSIAGQF